MEPDRRDGTPRDPPPLNQPLAAAKAAWMRDVLGPALVAAPERSEHFETVSGIPLETLYSPLDAPESGYLEDIGFPGAFPFTRGVNPAGYRQNFWIFGQYSGFGSAAETNQRFRQLLEQGQTGFSVALDLPTQVGYDPDDPLSAGEVGKVGVSLASLADMEELFAGIPFGQVRQIRTTAHAIGPIFAAMLIAMARRQGVDPRTIKIFIGNDPLKEYFSRGTQIYPPAVAVQHSIDLVEYCAREGLDTWTPLSTGGYVIRDAGASAIQEVAFSFSDALVYFDEAVRRGIDLGRVTPSVWAFLASDIDLLEEVAKFRAARRIWARLMRDRYGLTDPKAQALQIFAFTLGSRLTAQQPMNNIARVAVMTLAAALGGASTLHTAAYDEAYAIPTAAAATLALRTQQVVAHETGVTNVVDPLGGSWAVERLTTELERRILDTMKTIAEQGGAVRCVESGWFSRALAENAFNQHRAVQTGKRTVVGVNRYQVQEETRIPVFRVDPAVEERACTRLREVRANRDSQRAAAALAAVAAAARRGENLVYPLIPAVEAYCTVGEICGVLRSLWGTHQDTGDS